MLKIAFGLSLIRATRRGVYHNWTNTWPLSSVCAENFTFHLKIPIESLMRSIIHFSITLLLILSCKSEKASSGGDPPWEKQGSPLSMLYGRWPNTSTSPITSLIVANNFSSNEKDLIRDMANEWITAADSRFEFYPTPLNSVPGNQQTNGYTNLDQYLDNELGIYKSSTWFSDVSEYALAITQFFGYRRNAGTANEYIELTHADIILNFRDFTFSNDSSPNTYDLPSVVLHELGHFLGLPHSDYGSSSVMIPSLAISSEKRVPLYHDQQNILFNYGVIGNISAGYAAAIPIRPSSHPQEGEFVGGRIELDLNGECKFTTYHH